VACYEGSLGNHCEDVYKVLNQRAGLSLKQFETALAQDCQLLNYSVEDEIIPRLNYLEYMQSKGQLCFPEESIASYITRQPQILEHKLEELQTFNDNYIAINKPFRCRHDTMRGSSGSEPRYTKQYIGDTSAEEWLEERYSELPGIGFCHQLDFATTGILLAAKSNPAAESVEKLFQKRQVRQSYLALVFGHPERDTWTCEDPISKDENDPKKLKMRRASDGMESSTKFTVLSRGHLALPGPHVGAPISKLLVQPLTDRRHQIRVHCAASGHPIVGDTSYSWDTDTHRMFLLAHSLSVPLPVDDQVGPPIDIYLPEPRAWQQAMSVLTSCKML